MELFLYQKMNFENFCVDFISFVFMKAFYGRKTNDKKNL